MPKSKKCKRCGKVRGLKFFGKNVKAKDGHLSVCRSCKGDIMREAHQRLKAGGSPHTGPNAVKEPRKQPGPKPAKKLEMAQKALMLSSAPEPDDEQILWFLRGMAFMEGLPLDDFVKLAISAYKSQKASK